MDGDCGRYGGRDGGEVVLDFGYGDGGAGYGGGVGDG